MADVIGIGSAFIDYFFETTNKDLKNYNLKAEDDFLFREKNISPSLIFKKFKLLNKSSGGVAADTIAVLANLGVNVGYCATIGADPNGDYWLRNLKGVTKSKIERAGKTSICACLLTNKGKNRTFLSKVNPYDNEFLKNLDYDYLNKSKIIYIGPLIANPNKGIEITRKIISKISGPKLCFAPSILYIAEGPKKIYPILKKTNIIFLNKKELKYLIKGKPEVSSKQLLTYGPEIVVCTLGENGALVTTKNQQFYSPRFDVDNIIDSTGAGDAFAAGFIYGLLNSKSLKWSARFANKIASSSLKDYGLHWLKRYDL